MIQVILLYLNQKRYQMPIAGCRKSRSYRRTSLILIMQPIVELIRYQPHNPARLRDNRIHPNRRGGIYCFCISIPYLEVLRELQLPSYCSRSFIYSCMAWDDQAFGTLGLFPLPPPPDYDRSKYSSKPRRFGPAFQFFPCFAYDIHMIPYDIPEKISGHSRVFVTNPLFYIKKCTTTKKMI